MSDQYIVSARKYRPQTFETVVGQEHITTTLKNAIRHQHLAHAYLFCGPRGVGKTTCARILARTINCETPTPDMEACGTCATCQSFKNNTSFNVFELDAASNNSVDDIRELVNQVRFAPQQGKYKIYIIDEVHMLSASAFNAFLKTLEEPPPYAIFILATTEKHKILPTILSRCQIFDFKRITTGDITGHLQGIATKEGLQAQEAALHVIAQKSEGCMRDALSMLDRIASFTNGSLTYAGTMEHLNLLDADYYFKLTDFLLAQDVSGALLLLDQVLEKGFEGDVVISGLSEHFRNLLLCKDNRMVKLLDVPQEHRYIYFEKANQTPPSFILSALNVLNDAELGYKNASNKRLHIELCLIRLCYLLQTLSAEDLKKNDSPDLSPAAGDFQAPPMPAPPVVAPPAPSYTMPAAPPPVVQEPEPVMQAQPVQQPQPVPEQKPVPQPVPAYVPPQPQNGSGPARRISKNLLGDLETLGSQPLARLQPQQELQPQQAQDAFDRFKDIIRDERQSMLHVQLSMLKAEVLPPDEIRFICPTDMAEEYAKNQRNRMIEFFREQTGMMVRITTELRIDPALQSQAQSKVLSKPEMYAAMAQKNPNLALLKDGLNLQIEY